MLVTTIRLDRELVEQLRARADKLGLRYQQLLRLIVKNHINSPVTIGNDNP